MKTKFLVLALLVGLLFTSCAEPKTIDGITYRPYGLLNETEQKNPNIKYEISGWAVASGIIFSETIIVPVYTFGFNLWEPIGKVGDAPETKGVVTKENKDRF